MFFLLLLLLLCFLTLLNGGGGGGGYVPLVLVRILNTPVPSYIHIPYIKISNLLYQRRSITNTLPFFLQNMKKPVLDRLSNLIIKMDTLSVNRNVSLL